jgi:hypothetical protein
VGFEGQNPDKRHCKINDFLLLFVSFVEAPRLVNDLLSLFFIFFSHLRMQPRFTGDDMESRERRTSTFRLKRTYNYKPKETAIPVPMYLYKPMPEFRKER